MSDTQPRISEIHPGNACDHLKSAYFLVCSTVDIGGQLFPSPKQCLAEHYKTSAYYECCLKHNYITIEDYKHIYNPSIEIGNQIANDINNFKSDMYIKDKLTRIQNYKQNGRF